MATAAQQDIQPASVQRSPCQGWGLHQPPPLPPPPPLLPPPQVTREGVVVELACEVKRGDGIAFDRGDPQSREEGGLVYEILTQQVGSALNC